MQRKLEKLFDEQVRPSLAAHGGNVEIIDVDSNKVYIRMSGGCQGCSSSNATLKGGIETLVKKKFPFIEEVVDMTDHDQGENPYYK